MAVKTHKVKIKALNDSKQIGILVYVSSIVVVGLGVITFGLRKQLLIYMTVFGAALLVAATVILSVVFIPRVKLIHSASRQKELVKNIYDIVQLQHSNANIILLWCVVIDYTSSS